MGLDEAVKVVAVLPGVRSGGETKAKELRAAASSVPGAKVTGVYIEGLGSDIRVTLANPKDVPKLKAALKKFDPKVSVDKEGRVGEDLDEDTTEATPTKATAPCPVCGTKVLKATGRCVKCNKVTVKKDEDVDEAYMLASDIKVGKEVHKKGKTVKVLKDMGERLKIEVEPGVVTHVTKAEIKKFTPRGPGEDVDEADVQVALTGTDARELANMAGNYGGKMLGTYQMMTTGNMATIFVFPSKQKANTFVKYAKGEGHKLDEDFDMDVAEELDEAVGKDRTMRQDVTFDSEEDFEKFVKAAGTDYGAVPKGTVGRGSFEVSMHVPVDADKYAKFEKAIKAAGERPLKRETWLGALPGWAKKKLPDDVKKELGL
jgi:hypothetical protein